MRRHAAPRGAQLLERRQLRTAGRAAGQMRLDLVDLHVVELTVQIGLQQRAGGFTFHAGLRASGESAFLIILRARARRDITVPMGTPRTAAISRYGISS